MYSRWRLIAGQHLTRISNMTNNSRASLLISVLVLGLASAPVAFAQDKMGKDSMTKETMRKDGMKKDDAMSKDSMKK